MDEEDRLVSELSFEQAKLIDSVIGKKIWNIEVVEDGEQSMVKIEFSEDQTDFLMIHADGMDLYVGSPKPEITH